MVCVLGGGGSVMMVFWVCLFFPKQKKRVEWKIPMSLHKNVTHNHTFAFGSSIEEGWWRINPTLEKCVCVCVCRSTMSLSIVIYTHEYSF